MNTTLIPIYDAEQADGPSLNEAVLGIIRGLDQSILHIGLALDQIRKDKLHKDLGYRFMSHYIQDLCETTSKDRSSIYSWLKMGEVYNKHKKDLEKAGFGPRDPSKLLYLERALAKYPKKEVYANLKTMSQRKFAAYARGKETVLKENTLDLTAPGPQTSIRNQYQREIIKDLSNYEIINQGFNAPDWGHTFFYGKKLAAWVNKGLSEKALSVLLPAMRISFNVIDREGYGTVVHLDTLEEYLSFGDYAKRAREEMRRDLR